MRIGVVGYLYLLFYLEKTYLHDSRVVLQDQIAEMRRDGLDYLVRSQYKGSHHVLRRLLADDKFSETLPSFDLHRRVFAG